jgi:hypothetical protein
MSQKALTEKLQKIQEQKEDVLKKKQALDQLETELVEMENLYKESLAQEIQKQENLIDLDNYLESKISEFEDKAKKLNLTNLKFVHDKDKHLINLIYIDQNDYAESVSYIHDYSILNKTYVKDVIDFHVKNIEIYNNLINELPTDFFGYISFYHDSNTIVITTESTYHSFKPVENSNKYKLSSYISSHDIKSFVLTLENNLELTTDMYKPYHEKDNPTEINIELSRTSIVEAKNIASQINQDINDLENQLNNNFKIECL